MHTGVQHCSGPHTRAAELVIKPQNPFPLNHLHTQPVRAMLVIVLVPSNGARPNWDLDAAFNEKVGAVKKIPIISLLVIRYRPHNGNCAQQMVMGIVPVMKTPPRVDSLVWMGHPHNYNIVTWTVWATNVSKSSVVWRTCIMYIGLARVLFPLVSFSNY